VIGFDLRPLSPADTIWKRGGLVFALTILVAVGLELLEFVWSERTTLSGPSLRTATGGIILALTIAMLGFLSFGVAGVPRLLPGAEALTIDAAGVYLVYRKATRVDFPWTDRSGFVLRDYSAFPDILRDGRTFILRGPHFWRRRTLLTREAFEAVLAEARGRGAKVRCGGEALRRGSRWPRCTGSERVRENWSGLEANHEIC
jgi:hypothetical protein